MTNWVGSSWWELRLLPGWSARQDPECLTLTKSDEGALQLSGSVKTKGIIDPSEIQAHATRQARNGTSLEKVSLGAFEGWSEEFLEKASYWRRYWLWHGNLLIFVTYNGSSTASRAEEADVRSMLCSLRIRKDLGGVPS